MIGLYKTIRMGWPVYAAFVLILMAVFVPDFVDIKSTITRILSLITHPTIPFLTLALDELPVNPVTLSALALFFLVFAATRNYSKLVQTRLSLTASFNDYGVTKRVNRLPKSLSGRYPIPDNWAEKQEAFFKKMDARMRTEGLDLSFSDHEYLSAVGHAKFEVTRLSGFQVYLVSNGEGKLKFHKNSTDDPVHTSFKLSDGADNKFRFSLLDLLKGKIYIPLVYEQKYRRTDGSEHHFAHLIVVTEVSMFPYLIVKESLYLAVAEMGTFIPVGYCTYSDHY